jgi:hypothetical protein
MKKSIYRLSVIAFLFSLNSTVFGQAATKTGGHIELEVDPIAYALKGYSFHAGYQKGILRYDVGVFGIEEPKAFSKNEDFKVQSKGFGVKVDYVGDRAHGWFLGAEADYGFITATYKANSQRERGNTFGVGLRTGYRLMFGNSSNSSKGFYITPWIGVDKIFNTSKVNFKEADYKHESFRFFPTVHLGWRF